MKTDDKVELFLTESINGHAKKTKNRKRLWTAKTQKKDVKNTEQQQTKV